MRIYVCKRRLKYSTIILKYKDLLDEGIITTEEFCIKEEELLRKAIKYVGIVRSLTLGFFFYSVTLILIHIYKHRVSYQ